MTSRFTAASFGAGIVVTTLGFAAPATSQTCNFDTGNRMTVSKAAGVQEYRVNDASFNFEGWYRDPTKFEFDDITPHSSATPSRGANTMVYAAAVWNEQANGGIHQYVGTTSLTRDDYDAAHDTFDSQYGDPGFTATSYLEHCEDEGITFSLHTVSGAYVRNGGRTTPYCHDTTPCSGGCGSVGGEYYTIELYPIDDNGFLDDRFFTGHLPSGVSDSRDIIETMVHEMGHTMNIDHGVASCTGGVDCVGVMGAGGPGPNARTRMRHLHRYDVKCAYEVNGQARDLDPISRTYNTGFGSEATPAGTATNEMISIGFSYHENDFAYLLKRDDCWYWSPVGCLASIDAPSDMVGTAPTVLAHDHSYPAYWRLYYPSHTAWSGTNTVDATDEGYLEPQSKSRVVLDMSANDFSTTYTYFLRRCGGMSSRMLKNPATRPLSPRSRSA